MKYQKLNIDEKVKAKWKADLQKLIKIWSVAEHSVFPKLSQDWQDIKSILNHIIETREMPRDKYSRIQSLADPAVSTIGENNKLTGAIVDMRIKLLGTKTMLVYERLNAFYK
jgi:hypothetical protein